LILNDDSINEDEKKQLTKFIFKNNPYIEGNKGFRINSNSNVGNTYFKFVEYLTKKSELLGVTICELETFLFGWDLTSKQLKNYLNPRIVYNQFFKKYFKL
jgi:hypothetical protein